MNGEQGLKEAVAGSDYVGSLVDRVNANVIGGLIEAVDVGKQQFAHLQVYYLNPEFSRGYGKLLWDLGLAIVAMDLRKGESRMMLTPKGAMLAEHCRDLSRIREARIVPTEL